MHCSYWILLLILFHPWLNVCPGQIGTQNQKTEIQTVVQSGHPGIGGLMAFDYSGTYLAVANRLSRDVTVWHISTRTLMAKFESPRNQLHLPFRLFFIEAPLRLILMSESGVESWEIDSGDRRLVPVHGALSQDGRLRDTPRGAFSCIGISRSGKWQAVSRIIDGMPRYVVMTMDETIRRELPGGLIPRQFGFSHDDRFVVITQLDSLIVFDIETEKTVCKIAGDGLTFQCADFSPSNGYLQAKAHENGRPYNLLFRVSSGEPVLRQEDTLLAAPFQVSDDDRTAYLCKENSQSASFLKHDLRSGSVSDLIRLDANASAIAVHSGSGLFAITSTDLLGQPSIVLHDATSGEIVGELKSHIDRLGNLHVDDSEQAVIEQMGARVYTWNVDTLDRRSLPSPIHGRIVKAHDGRLLAWGAPLGQRTVALYSRDDSAQTNYRLEKWIRLYKGKLNQPNPVSVSPNLRFVAAGDEADVVWCDVNVESVKRLMRKGEADQQPHRVSILAVSNDGQQVLVADSGGRIERWLTSDSKCDKWVDHPMYRSAVYENASSINSIVDTGEEFIFAGEFGVSRFTTSGEVVPIHVLRPSTSLVLSADRTTLAWIDLRERKIRIFDVKSRLVTASLGLRDYRVMSIMFGCDSNELYLILNDGSVQVWNIDDESHTATYSCAGSGNLVVATPDGYYMSNREAVDAISFREGGNMYLPEQFDVERNRPDIVLERLGHSTPETLNAYRAVTNWRQQREKSARKSIDEKSERIPQIRFRKHPPAQSTRSNVDFSVYAQSDADSVASLHVSINDVPVTSIPGAMSREPTSIRVELTSGKNQIDVWAENARGLRSRRLTQIVTCQQQSTPARTWFIGVGVSEYRDRTHNLKFAAKDARDLGETFRQHATGPFEMQLVEDDEANRKNIQSVIRTTLSQTSTQDLVILFFAGHGLLNGDEYRFALHGCSFDAPKAESLSFEELEGLFAGCRARQRIVMIDSCHAGDPLPTRHSGIHTEGVDIMPRGASIATAAQSQGPSLRDLLIRSFSGVMSSSGTTVITASDGNQYALESSRWKNGAFTYVVREALADRLADLNEDNQITAGELRHYVSRRVSEITGGSQTPQQKRQTKADPVILSW